MPDGSVTSSDPNQALKAASLIDFLGPYAFDYVVYGLAAMMIIFGLQGLLFSSGATQAIVRTAAKL